MRNRFAPPQNVTTTFRFRPAEYHRFDGAVVPYHQYYLHFSATNKRSFICSKTWEMNESGDIYAVGGKCLGCDEMDDGSKSVDRRLMHAFNGIHMAYFHPVQVEDKKTGKPVSTKEGKPVMELIPCKGRACELCRKKVDKVFGKASYFPLGTGHLDNLVGFSEEIEKRCVCGGNLTPVTYGCLKCSAILLDVADCDLSDEDLNKWSKKNHKCPECGLTDIAIPEKECDNCSTPTPLEIFDVDMEIKKQGEGPKTVIQIPRWTHKELSEELDKMDMPPLDKILKGSDFEWQAKCLGIDNPYKGEKGKPEDHVEGYDDDKAKDPDEVPF